MKVELRDVDSAALTAGARAMVAAIEGMIIDSDAIYEEACRELVKIVERRKELEQQQADILDPLKVASKNVKALFEPALAALKAGESALRGHVSHYLLTQSPVVAKTGVSGVKRWVGVIEDRAAFLHFIADHLDRYGYLVADEPGKLNRLAHDTGGVLQIPGVRFEETKSARVGA